jgi:hypothetical protein
MGLAPEKRFRLMRLLFLGALIALSTGCEQDCDDYAPAAIEGDYRGVTGRNDQLTDVRVVASEDEVTLTYARPDGTRFRALYKIRHKRKR